MSFLSRTIPVDVIKKPYQTQGVSLHVLRLDLVHSIISGNKWFKLKEYLKTAEREGKENILTFGGAFSNHIIATAALAKEKGLRSAGIIRGERPSILSHTLEEAQGFGMQLFYLSRERYRFKEVPAEVWQQLERDHTTTIPEGGYGQTGAAGAAGIVEGLDLQDYSHITASVGTGTTLAGLIQAALPGQIVLGFSALKNHFGLTEEISSLLPDEDKKRFELNHDYHFGGYAKHDKTLIDFMNTWYDETGIPTDFVYTGKLFFALDKLIRSAFFPDGSQILAIHTGGLQGNRSLGKGTLIFMPD